MINKTKWFRRLLILAFAISGFTALVYEVVWTRPLQLIFGSTIYAVSTMLTAFMFGFALGSYLFRNLADRVKRPVLLFAFLEGGIGLYGFIILSLFAILPSLYLSLLEMPGFQFLQFILCFIVLLLPATLFGATWPVINRTYAKLETVGEDAGILYSFNSLGGVLGSLAAGFLLIPTFGIRNTSMLTASLNLIVAIVIVLGIKFVFDQNKTENEKE